MVQTESKKTPGPQLSFWNKLYLSYNKSDYVKPFLALTFFIFSVVFLSIYVKNPDALAKSSYNYYFLSLLAVLGVGYYLFNNPNMINSLGVLVAQHPFLITLSVCTFTLLSIVLYTFLSTTNSNTYYWTGRIIDIITIGLIALVGLLLFYEFINNGNLYQRGWSSVVSDVLFYLPCKLRDLLVWFLGEIKNTPQKVFLLVAVEIALLVWIFYYKHTMKWFSIGQQVFPIYKEYSFLKDRTPITSYAGLSKETGISNQAVPMNFGISFWVYLNDNTKSVETELPVFCYGGGERTEDRECASSSNPYAKLNVHPAITFIPTGESSENIWKGAGLSWNMGHLKIYFSDCSSESENSMLLDIPLQRWNLIAINYTSQQADVFLNGEIIASHTFTEPPVYNLGDSIEIGGKDLQGSIKNIQYSVLPFSKITVSAMYNNNMLFSNLLPNFVLR